jgi:hypothetical protein
MPVILDKGFERIFIGNSRQNVHEQHFDLNSILISFKGQYGEYKQLNFQAGTYQNF